MRIPFGKVLRIVGQLGPVVLSALGRRREAAAVDKLTGTFAPPPAPLPPPEAAPSAATSSSAGPAHPALRRGPETSEYKLTLLTTGVGLVIFLLGLLWPESWAVLPVDELREFLIALGALLLGIPAAVYGHGRARIKAEMLGAQTAATAAMLYGSETRGKRRRRQRGG